MYRYEIRLRRLRGIHRAKAVGFLKGEPTAFLIHASYKSTMKTSHCLRGNYIAIPPQFSCNVANGMGVIQWKSNSSASHFKIWVIDAAIDEFICRKGRKIINRLDCIVVIKT